MMRTISTSFLLVGMDTVSLPADWALRTRVSMSAMGSVIVMFVFSFDP